MWLLVLLARRAGVMATDFADRIIRDGADGRPRSGPRTRRNRHYTGPVEDYLKAIYELERGGTATTTEIAHRLEIAPASVTGMIRRLAEQRLLGARTLSRRPAHGDRPASRAADDLGGTA